MVWWYGGMVGWVLLPGSLTGGYKIATNLPKQFANLQQMHVNTDMTDTRHKKHTGLEGGGCAWPGWMGWLGVAFKSESAGGWVCGRTSHLWRMPSISDWQQLPERKNKKMKKDQLGGLY